MQKNRLFILFLFMSPFLATSQVIKKFELALPAATDGWDIPASIDLDEITFTADSSLSLVEIKGNKKIPIPFQLEQGEHRRLYWLVETNTDHAVKRTYELIKEAPASFDKISADEQGGAFTFQSGNTHLLRYHSETVYPPAGIDSSFRRSGFIHPLWAPHGQELTRIQPNDHYHHYGIWNPWTHVLFENDSVDFWNIGDKKATVRFAGLASKTEGPVFAELQALHDHIVFKKDGHEKTALHELQTIRVYKPAAGSNYFIVDIVSQMNCASESPFHIVAYRYGGFGWRATEFWDKSNCEILTSEGKDRSNTDGSKAKWCMVTGALPGNDNGGALIMSYPGNYNHPEPLRIWDEHANKERGDMFVNFAPTKDKDWILEPGKTYVLKYRMIVFNGKPDATKAESAWQYFAMAPVIKMLK